MTTERTPLRLAIGQGLKSTFLRHVLLVAGGSAISQVVTLLAAPLVTRLYSPHAFGVYGLFIAAISIFRAAATLGYSQALVLPASDRTAGNLMWAGMLSGGALTVLLAVGVWAVSGTAMHDRIPGSDHLWLLPVAAVPVAIGLAMQGWCIRKKLFRLNAQAASIRAFAVVAAQIIYGVMGGGVMGLAAGFVAGEAVASGVLFYSLWRRADIAPWPLWRRLLASAKRYIDFPKYATPQGVLNASSVGLPVIVLAAFHGPEVAGFYSLAMRVFQVPLNLIANSVRPVLLQRVSETANGGGDVHVLFLRLTRILMAIVVVPSILAVAFAPDLFRLAFGTEWEQAGELGRWLVLWTAFAFANVPASVIARALRYQDRLLAFEILVLVVRVVSLSVGGLYFGAEGTVAIFSVSGALLYVLLIVGVWRITRARHGPHQSFVGVE